jgi:hypothetical protein
MSQTTVSLYQDAAFVGMLDGIGHQLIDSFSAEEIIPLAYPLMRGTNATRQVKKATSGAAAFAFAIHDHAREQSSAGVVQFAIGESVNVLKRGRFWIMTNDAVAAGAVANLHVASGTLTDEAVTTGIEAFTQFSARFQTATSAAGLALVEIK